MAAIFVLAAAALTLSCSWGIGSQVQTRNYYILSYTPATEFPASSRRPYDFALQIGQFDVQRIFNRQNILYRFSPHQIQYYELQQWAVRPDQMFGDIVLKHCEAADLTNRIGTDFYDSRPDFRLDGMVEALEKYDAGDLFYAHLSMSFKLLRVSTGEQVWAYSFDQRKQVFQSDMVYTVRGLSSILESEMNIVVGQLDSLFLVMTGGTPATAAAPVEDEQASAPADRPAAGNSGVDESAFEIIPESR